MRLAPSSASSHTQRIPGSISQLPSRRTPPHGPLRCLFGQFIGHAMPVDDNVHLPHIWQSKKNPLSNRSAGATKRWARRGPIQATPRRSRGAIRRNRACRRPIALAWRTDQRRAVFILAPRAPRPTPAPSGRSIQQNSHGNLQVRSCSNTVSALDKMFAFQTIGPVGA